MNSHIYNMFKYIRCVLIHGSYFPYWYSNCLIFGQWQLQIAPGPFDETLIVFDSICAIWNDKILWRHSLP